MARLAGGEAGIGERLKAVEHAFDRVWCARYAPGETGRYVFQFAKDVPLLKRLLRNLPIEEIEGRMAAYLRDDDPFYVKAKHPIGLFSSNVNRYATAAATPDLQLAPVADCKHRPPCQSDQEHTKRKTAEMRGDGPF